MKTRTRRSPETVFKQVFFLVLLLGIFSIIKSTSEFATYAKSVKLARSLNSGLEPVDESCRLVHRRTDQCAFVKASCPDEEAGLLSYLQLYYCTLKDVKWIAFIILAVWISVLFSTIGIAASDFLCLNLSTIAAVMGMSESLAGVTFLAFGNGSPDVFSTFASFASHSGSLAVGELIGAAGFITAVVAGSMAITKPFKVGKKAFTRDVLLFTVAAAFSLNFLKDGSLKMWECIVMVCFYVAYVMFVVAWHWYFDRRRRMRVAEAAARLHHHIPDQQELEVPEIEEDEESRPTAERAPLLRTASGGSLESTYIPGTPAWAVENVDEMDDETRDQYLAALSSNMRVIRLPGGRRNTTTPIRPSLIGALEFRSVLSALEKKSTNAQPIYMRRYSDDGRSMLGQIAETPTSVSHPELLSEHAQRSSPTGGRNRAVSAGNVDDLRLTEDLLDIHAGTPETAIYSPIGATRPAAARTHSSQSGSSQRSLRPQSQQSNQLLLSPASIPSVVVTPGNETPKSMAATKNGLLAPPGPDFHRPDFVGDQSRPARSPISPGAISPLALTPRLEIPHHSPGSVQEWRYTDSPQLLSPYSRPPSINLPPPSVSPESSHLFPLPEDLAAPQRKFKWWPYKYLPAPQIMFATLFPGLYDWSEKGWPDKILAICTAPTLFLLTITVPVVDEQKEEEELAAKTPLLTPLPISPDLSRHGIRLPIESPVMERRMSVNPNNTQIATTDENAIGSGPREWNRWLAIVQVFTAPLFMVIILWANITGDESDRMLLLKLVLGSLVFSLLGLALLLAVTSPTQEPKHKPVLCFLGFFVAIAWISTIASEVVGVLKAFGVILDISDAILGLTIFAVGNSLGDLVADITVARLGFPMMALSACFGGPMLNILLGIGIGGLYQTISEARNHARNHPTAPWHYKPYELEISTTLLISGATLLITLVFLLIVVPLNKWRMDRKIGIALIAIWATSTIVNVALELVGIGERDWSLK